MKLPALGLGAMLLACLASSPACANPWAVYPPIAPDAYGPGWYNTNTGGMTYGPNHWLRPAWEPFNGLRPNGVAPTMLSPQQAAQLGIAYPPQFRGAADKGPGLPPSPVFPTHPYARSPRDFFMLD